VSSAKAPGPQGSRPHREQGRAPSADQCSVPGTRVRQPVASRPSQWEGTQVESRSCSRFASATGLPSPKQFPSDLVVRDLGDDHSPARSEEMRDPLSTGNNRRRLTRMAQEAQRGRVEDNGNTHFGFSPAGSESGQPKAGLAAGFRRSWCDVIRVIGRRRKPFP